MRDEIAKLVYPILNYGLRLKDRREKGEEPNLEKEQAVLKGMLNADEGRRLPDFYGDARSEGSVSAMPAMESLRRQGDQFLGIRYALACWIDEILIDSSAWGRKWTEKQMESLLFPGPAERAWKFWEQARRAETRPGDDVLEIFFLCVMLGFRGERRNRPDALKEWVDANQARIAKKQGKQWPAPPALAEPPANVPPLRGRQKFQKMVLVAAGLGLVAILTVVAMVLAFGHR